MPVGQDLDEAGDFVGVLIVEEENLCCDWRQFLVKVGEKLFAVSLDEVKLIVEINIVVQLLVDWVALDLFDSLLSVVEANIEEFKAHFLEFHHVTVFVDHLDDLVILTIRNWRCIMLLLLHGFFVDPLLLGEDLFSIR